VGRRVQPFRQHADWRPHGGLPMNSVTEAELGKAYRYTGRFEEMEVGEVAPDEGPDPRRSAPNLARSRGSRVIYRKAEGRYVAD
jgi:hypothetical protein